MSDLIRGIGESLWKSLPALREQHKEVERVIIREVEQMLPRSGGNFVRLAGLSGALAVIIGAYGAHVFKPSEKDPNLKVVFESGNKYHLIHSVALLGVPLTNRPRLVGVLLSSGILLFSGSCYYHAFTEKTTIRRVTPYGGMLLILGWLAMVL